MYVHCLTIYNLFVRALETGRKVKVGELFYPASQRVRILYLSCHVKKVKTTAILSEKSRNKRRFNCYLMLFSV